MSKNMRSKLQPPQKISSGGRKQCLGYLRELGAVLKHQGGPPQDPKRAPLQADHKVAHLRVRIAASLAHVRDLRGSYVGRSVSHIIRGAALRPVWLKSAGLRKLKKLNFRAKSRFYFSGNFSHDFSRALLGEAKSGGI